MLIALGKSPSPNMINLIEDLPQASNLHIILMQLDKKLQADVQNSLQEIEGDSDAYLKWKERLRIKNQIRTELVQVSKDFSERIGEIKR